MSTGRKRLVIHPRVRPMPAYFLTTYYFPIFGLLTGGFALVRLDRQPLALRGNRLVVPIPYPHML